MKQIALIIIALLAIDSLKAQTASPELSFNHITLAVADTNRSAMFYTSVLQLTEIPNRANVNTMRWISLGGNLELHLTTLENASGSRDSNNHFALATPQFDAFMQRLREMKIPFENSDGKPRAFSTRADGVKQIYLQDPDGYWIEVNNIGEKKRP